MDVLSPKEIKERLSGKAWVSPYERILMMHDKKNDVVEIIEDHARGACYGGAAWEVHHYPRTSDLIFESRRDGARNIFDVKVGETKLDLIPGLAAAGIEKVEVLGNSIKTVYSGLGGAGVAVAMSRGLAEGVERVEVYEWGGGKKAAKASIVVPLHEKVIFGIDDTDNPTSGATWALANEIGYKLDQEEGIDYINHSIVQLYPNNPYKTQNCVSIAISFASLPDKVDSLIKEVENALKKYTDSEETGLAVHRGIIIPEEIKRYSNRAKLKMIEIGEAHKVAEECDIKLSTITGERGLIGALAAIGFADRPDDAVKVDV